MKAFKVIGLIVGSIACLAATVATAHIHVVPSESTLGATEDYKVTVPTEAKVSTIRVELVIPEGVELVSVADGADPHDVRKGEGGNSVITWRGEILPGWAREYHFTARNPRSGSEIPWHAHQFFADGTSADWVDVPGSKRPAPITTLVATP